MHLDHSDQAPRCRQLSEQATKHLKKIESVRVKDLMSKDDCRKESAGDFHDVGEKEDKGEREGIGG